MTDTRLEEFEFENENYYLIRNSNTLRPFFMSVVSDSNHWLFISSNGGLSAGRKNSEYALFPYYTDDKLTESVEHTGSKTIITTEKNSKKYVWEPFSIRSENNFTITRNLYKSKYGNKVIFEEVNHDLELTFKYQWNSSNTFGFVRKSFLSNNSENEQNVKLLDGIQNILPYGVGSDLQNQSSNLVDAYKKSEIVEEASLGIYALSAIISDKAEPSESLKANVVWSVGLEHSKVLLSSLQLAAFRAHKSIVKETEIRAEKGAYFLTNNLSLNKNETKEWFIVANVNQDHIAVENLLHILKTDKDLRSKINDNINLGTQNLIKLNAAADGIQLSSDDLRDTRHFSNSLFNIMRGGIFDDNYNIEKHDFINYLQKANTQIAKDTFDVTANLPHILSLNKLKETAVAFGNPDFSRLTIEYLPLKFSRRHGDPSRPWNKFSINTQNELDGSKVLDYQGNWRDIFQNWEALAHSYPEFMESMLYKFLNASTFDGYNPYRVTKDGFDWEVVEEHDPWSYIGYWGDHQVIYLLKFLEFLEKHKPGELNNYLSKNIFVYANVPYKIKSYDEIQANPKDTILFDAELNAAIHELKKTQGADATLLKNQALQIHHVNFAEKILATVLAKLANFIPEGGIWMNTQRPEWNDANNALVGNGVSMVTLYYLTRFLKFFDNILEKSKHEKVTVSEEMFHFFSLIRAAFKENEHFLASGFSNQAKKKVLDTLAQPASDYREKIYSDFFSGNKSELSVAEMQATFKLALAFLEQSIAVNKRENGLYHAYNLMTITNGNGIDISYLDIMLEGQVAVLSSGAISAEESLDILNSLKQSALFREDQYSYVLYPNKDLGMFLNKNRIPKESVQTSSLLSKLVNDNNTQVIAKDINGNYHFNGNFRNGRDLENALDNLSEAYAELVNSEKKQILGIFESVFNHKAFTGRSGTFFGYEGLGSIYWHMVSKLQLAVQEICIQAINDGKDAVLVGKLLEHYYEINEGIGVHKSPKVYGAFSVDPYSHTPAGKGAQQPGMTGQVKEDVLNRFGELGVSVNNGELHFKPLLLKKDEFLSEKKTFTYFDLELNQKELQINKGELAFTYCQIPIIYRNNGNESLKVIYKSGVDELVDVPKLSKTQSNMVFNRTGEIEQIIVTIK